VGRTKRIADRARCWRSAPREPKISPASANRYKDRIDEVEKAKNRTKAKVRSKVEHVFAVMKLKFGFVKVRYRGIAKNANRAVRDVRAGEPVSGSQETAGDDGGVVCPETAAPQQERGRGGLPLFPSRITSPDIMVFDGQTVTSNTCSEVP